MKKTISIRLQERYKTLERNKAMKWRYDNTPEKERWGLLTEMGKQYGISRERARVIVNNPNVALDDKHHNGFLGLLFRHLMGCLSRGVKDEAD